MRYFKSQTTFFLSRLLAGASLRVASCDRKNNGTVPAERPVADLVIPLAMMELCRFLFKTYPDIRYMDVYIMVYMIYYIFFKTLLVPPGYLT